MSDTSTAPAPVTEIPSFKNADGSFRKLRPRDFPRTRAGRQANCEYRAQVFEHLAGEWRQRATDIARQDDPKYLRERRIEKLKAQLAKLEAEETPAS